MNREWIIKTAVYAVILFAAIAFWGATQRPAVVCKQDNHPVYQNATCPAGHTPKGRGWVFEAANESTWLFYRVLK